MVRNYLVKGLIVIVIALVAFAVGNFFGAKNVTPFPRLTTISSLPDNSIIQTVRALASGMVTNIDGNMVTIENQGKTGTFPLASNVQIFQPSPENPFRYGTASAEIVRIRPNVTASLVLEMDGDTSRIIQISQPAFETSK